MDSSGVNSYSTLLLYFSLKFFIVAIIKNSDNIDIKNNVSYLENKIKMEKIE